MKTQTPTLRQIVMPVAAMIGAVAVAVFGWLAFGGSTPLQSAGYRVTISMPQALNVAPHTDVRIAGVSVGKVTEVEREGHRARVGLDLHGAAVPLRSGASAILRTKTLLGEPYIELTQGTGSGFVLDGGRLPASAVRPTQRLDDVLTTFDPATRQNVRSAIRGAETALSGRGEDLSDLLGWAAPASAELDQLTHDVDAQRSSLRTLIGATSDVLQTVNHRSDALGRLIDSGAELLSVTAAGQHGLHDTVQALPTLLSSLRASSETLDAASGDLTDAAHALRPVVPEVGPALTALDHGAPIVQRTLEDLPRIAHAAKSALPAADKIVSAVRKADPDLWQALRQLLPTFQYVTAFAKELVAGAADQGAASNGKLIGIGNTVQTYAPLVVTLSNEMIQGFKKRLPTVRANPYRKPGTIAASVTGKGTSYDCRNIGNPNVLPAFGSAPPCITQGPWTFLGKSAYFHRLLPAAP